MNNDFKGNLVADTLRDPLNTLNTYDLDEWIPFDAIIFTSVGAITTLGVVNCSYMQRGQLIFYNLDFVITTNGTGAGVIRVLLPIISRNFTNSSHMSGRASSGNMLQGYVPNYSFYMDITNYDGTYPGADGAVITISGSYAI